jgi:hypothetical protein
MSLNKFTSASYDTPKPWMDIRCNTISFGDGTGQLKTQAYVPVYSATIGTINGSSPFYYSCDHTSLRIKGVLDYTTSNTPHNNFIVAVSLPGELVSRFGSGGYIISTGQVAEYPNNGNVNNGLIASSEYTGGNDGVELKIFWNNGNVSTTFDTRIYVDICIFKQG